MNESYNEKAYQGGGAALWRSLAKAAMPIVLMGAAEYERMLSREPAIVFAPGSGQDRLVRHADAASSRRLSE